MLQYSVSFSLFFMATAATQISRSLNNNINSSNTSNGVFGEEVHAAIAKANELRAIHAALMHGNNPPNLRVFPSVYPPRPLSHSSAQDYPVFTLSYEDQIHLKSQYLAENWNECFMGGGNNDATLMSEYYKNLNKSSRRRLISLEPRTCLSEDQKSVTGSSANRITLLRTLSGAETDYFCKSRRRTTLGEFKSANSNIVMPSTDPQASVPSRPRSRGGLNLSWLFYRLKKKHKNENNSPDWRESEQVSNFKKIEDDLGMMSVEALKKELIEANESRDAALMEVAEMKSSLGWLKQKLEYLENYCKDLKMTLRQEDKKKEIGKSIDGRKENLPVSDEVMVEGFLQIVSEARLSVKQFCRALLAQIEGTDDKMVLIDSINFLLQPYDLSVSCKYSKTVLYHLESIINQSLYQDFENCVFQRSGSSKILDPRQDRHERFSSFVALRNLSWNQVLRKGAKYYSEEFSKFCDQKMSSVVAILNLTRLLPEQLLQAFFVAVKCIWLVHLLAFSFSLPLGIIRVEENRDFDSHYMEDIFMGRQRSQGPRRVKIMVMPGFYVKDSVLRCKVLCKYKSVS